MINYSNPQVIKEVVEEAKEAGIFNKKLNIKKQHHIFIFKVSTEDSMTLDMFNDNKNYGYKLRQVDFELGLSSNYNPKRTSINYLKKTLFGRYVYEIKCLIETKSEAVRSWDKVSGKPLRFFFESKDKSIDIITVISSKRLKIKEIQ